MCNLTVSGIGQRHRAILCVQAVPRCRSILHLHWHDL
nr:MAG TPA: hypothetical protein [Caudoviricetes sp.]